MNNLIIVLVKSKYPRNVGLISRIMSNYSIKKLILVSPRCQLDFEAQKGAAQGQDALQSATIYDSWDKFYENEVDGLRIAFSRRQGRRRASLPLAETLELPVVALQRPTYLIFGAEDHGLSAHDMEHTHLVTHYDLPGELQSMNLSHAVLVAVLSFYNKFAQINSQTNKAEPPDLTNDVTEDNLYKDPEPILRLWLESLNFNLETQTRWNALTMLKQLILKACPTPEETRKLEMIIHQTIRKINLKKPQ
jgi:TrmH family RNA methyltransferase